jgi:hypothetical protein
MAGNTKDWVKIAAMWQRAASLILAAMIFMAGGRLYAQTTTSGCPLRPQNFSLRNRDLPVGELNGGIFFTSGMTIDADGAPNAYGPKNKGLDYTANARGAHGWAALVTNKHGIPVRQKSGQYRGFYVSTTSLEQTSVKDVANPTRYIDARTIPYIALPKDFAERFGIGLGDLAVVMNEANGRSAYAIFADVGPRGRIGEGSIALATELGLPANPRHDQAFDQITYLIFPGSGAGRWKRITPARVQSLAASSLQQWMNETATCYDGPARTEQSSNELSQ